MGVRASFCRLEPEGTEALTPRQVQEWTDKLTKKVDDHHQLNLLVASVKTLTSGTRGGEQAPAVAAGRTRNKGCDRSKDQ